MDTVTFNGEEYVKASTVAKPIEGLRYCIIRCSGAGDGDGFGSSSGYDNDGND